MISFDGVRHEIDSSEVLRIPSLTFKGGQFAAVVGPNGAGKSTLLGLGAGIDKPTEGTVLMNGVDVRSKTLSQMSDERAYLDPSPPINLRFTVEDVVRMSLGARLSAGDSDEKMLEALALMDLLPFRSRPLRSLSTGEARRSYVASVLAKDLPIWLLDEPVSGLDVAHAERAHVAMANAAESGRTVVAVLHDLNSAIRHASRLLIVSEGRVVADGPPAQVVTAELLTDVYGYPMRVSSHPDGDYPLVTPG